MFDSEYGEYADYQEGYQEPQYLPLETILEESASDVDSSKQRINQRQMAQRLSKEEEAEMHLLGLESKQKQLKTKKARHHIQQDL